VKNKFILNSDPQLSNSYIYSGTMRDSIKDKQTLTEGKVILGGYIKLADKVLVFKKNKLYFNGFVFRKLE
jgi:hypothetical protein